MAQPSDSSAAALTRRSNQRCGQAAARCYTSALDAQRLDGTVLLDRRYPSAVRCEAATDLDVLG